jgi:hypothetical protein
MKKTATVGLWMILAAAASWAQEVERYFPGAASASGSKGAFFVTDARLYNPSAGETITVHLSFLERDENNNNASELSVQIPPRSGVAFNDILASFFGLSQVAGAVRMRADSLFFATSRTYDIGSAEGTFGTFIPGVSPDEALERGILLQILNDPSDSGFRSNIGFTNPNRQKVTVTVRVFDADTGQLVGERERDLPARTFSQIDNVFNFIREKDRVSDNATVEFVADAPVLAYATVIDNTSNDPIFVLPFADAGTPINENRAPNATITNPDDDVMVVEGESVAFAGTVSDPDGDDVTVVWDFGDGITSSLLDPSPHIYTDAGTYTVSLTATDEFGLADPTPPTRTITVNPQTGMQATFTNVQNQIFNPSCAFSGCHSSGSASAGLDLSEGQAYDNIVNVPSDVQGSKDLVEPGDADNSYLYLKVIGDESISGGQMPRFGDPLSQDLQDLLRDWIEAGAQNN